ncbi:MULTISPECIES: nitrous oxide reductase family maturation protein NosD [unclassified Streptomyces]|uniref:right-handed parallel beta-helix repeat-containing protein n=1 Tax=unclassified Streptomyces TaxID=2593676 RepID=UPI002251BE82|nr:right-handed parallel beta-helix repeat-containing protein [Streptomyces sp. NBC_00047]MCX5608494.1 right-handed parallel beta-helix repeat-containing protein [Streptomyces sp. NBC_00047]
MKKTILVAACAAVATAFPAVPSQAAQVVLVVDDNGAQCPGAPFTTIQAAITAASPGDEIRVCAGTYNEVVTVNKANLRLVGPAAAPAETACRQAGAPDPSRQAIIQSANGSGSVRLAENGIRFSRFTVQNNTSSYGIVTSAAHSGHQVRQNVIQGNVFGVYFNSSGTNLSEVEQNCIRQNNEPGSASGSGVYSDAGLKNADIERNTFSGNENSGVLLDALAPGGVDNVRVNRNTSLEDRAFVFIFKSSNVSVGSNIIRDNFGAPGIFFGDSNTNLRITSNIIERGFLGVRANAFGLSPNANVTITGNIIRNSESSTVGHGISVAANSLTNSVISRNIVSDNAGDGIRIDAGGNGGNTIRSNAARRNGMLDCRDNTSGTGTDGTANTWTGNIGPNAAPPGICL